MNKKERFAFLGLMIGLGLLYSILPSLGSRIFSSPDETATAIAAYQIAHTGQASIQEPLARAHPWVHPRSWISAGNEIVPVGFLGWPFLLSFFVWFVGIGALPWVGMLILLSSVWPFYRLLRRFGFSGAWWGTLVAYTFPTVILYANRSLFPNTGFIALSIWCLFWIDYVQTHRVREWTVVGLGCLLAITVAIRPIELLWLLPWFVWAGWSWRPTRRERWALAIGATCVLLPLAVLARGAYGSFFEFGYHALGNVTPLDQAPTLTIAPEVVPTSAQPWLPYGLNIKIALWNVWTFFIQKLWLWTFVMGGVACTYFWLRQQRAAIRRREAIVWLSAWTLLVLFIIYGSGLYRDRFGPVTATIGNSFLRYFLPVAWLGGLGFAYIWIRVRWKRFVPWLLPSLATCVSLFGIFQALGADDEGLLYTRKELIRYSTIRSDVQQLFSPGDLILSERSDKIFFPLFRAVSPLPNKQAVARWLRQRTGLRVGLFVRPLSQAEKDAWYAVGVEAQELASFGRERLYRLVLTLP